MQPLDSLSGRHQATGDAFAHALISSDRMVAHRAGPPGDSDAVRRVLGDVMDPEVPVINVVELGVIREIAWIGTTLMVAVTPTYSGCPATEVIEQSIHDALRHAGYAEVRLERRLSPAWTTDWISQAGRDKLAAYGIAPPVGSAAHGEHDDPCIPCPQCGSEATERVSEFGSTACKALYRCRDCLEPFDYFKCL